MLHDYTWQREFALQLILIVFISSCLVFAVAWFANKKRKNKEHTHVTYSSIPAYYRRGRKLPESNWSE